MTGFDFEAEWDSQSATPEDAMWAAWANPGDGLDASLPGLRPAYMAAGNVGEIGCGPGRLLSPVITERAAAGINGDVWGVDCSANMLRWARAEVGDGAHLDKVDAGMPVLPWVDGSMAGVWSTLAFQHMPVSTQRRYLAEAWRTAAAGCVLVVQFVTDCDAGVLSNPVPVGTMQHWAAICGWRDAKIETDDTYPTWRWLSATRGA